MEVHLPLGQFESHLEFICFEENPQILDDDRPDFFDNWLTELEVEEWLKYGNEYAEKTHVGS